MIEKISIWTDESIINVLDIATLDETKNQCVHKNHIWAKFAVQFFLIYLAVGQKISKMTIIFRKSVISPNPLRVFHRIIFLTYGQNMIDNDVGQ